MRSNTLKSIVGESNQRCTIELVAFFIRGGVRMVFCAYERYEDIKCTSFSVDSFSSRLAVAVGG